MFATAFLLGCGGSNDIVLNQPDGSARSGQGGVAGSTTEPAGGAGTGAAAGRGGSSAGTGSGGAEPATAGTGADGVAASGGSAGREPAGSGAAGGGPGGTGAGIGGGDAGGCERDPAMCNPCTSDADCGQFGDMLHCHLTLGICVECSLDAHCEGGQTCDDERFVCIDCSDSGCAGAGP